MRSKRSQTQKHKYSVILSMWNVQSSQTHTLKVGQGLPEGGGRGEWGVPADWQQASFWGDESALEWGSGDGSTTL